jgi:MazG family protein
MQNPSPNSTTPHSNTSSTTRSTASTTRTDAALRRIIDIMVQLRDPETGCPWDVKQTFETIAPYTIEEAYETADAIQRGNLEDIRDELGDLLLQVVFQARIAEEAGHFDLADIATSISEKMIARHPHIFTDDSDRPNATRPNVTRPSADGQKQIWEEIKAEERAAKGKTGVLDDVAIGLSPMLRALKLQKRAARVGFDWLEFAQLRDKLHEETAELEAELSANTADRQKISDEVGDILFVAVNIARKAGVDPETALLGCNQKFEQRFRYIEQNIEKYNKSIEDSSLEEMESLWQEAKSATKSGRSPDKADNSDKADGADKSGGKAD